MIELGYEKDIENIHNWALDHMEGCDEPEWTMFNKIASAIENYWAKMYSKAIDDAITQMPNALKMLENS